MGHLRLVVIGNGMVGQRFLESLPATAPFAVTVLGEEPRAAYDRVQLSTFFSGTTAEELSVVPEGFFARAGVDLRLNEQVTMIDRAARCVRTRTGGEFPYDKLVMATGSYPFVPPVPGRERAGCHVYRTIEDLEAIRASANGSAQRGGRGWRDCWGWKRRRRCATWGSITHVVEFAPG